MVTMKYKILKPKNIESRHKGEEEHKLQNKENDVKNTEERFVEERIDSNRMKKMTNEGIDNYKDNGDGVEEEQIPLRKERPKE